MYFKIYNINNLNKKANFDDINILRFSYNKFNLTDPDIDSSKIIEFITYLKNLAETDKICYNGIYPWDDIYIGTSSNKEIIIAYNNITNHIQGWCNISYSRINSSSSSYSTLFVDKIVTRAAPRVDYIALLLLEFIKNECVDKPIIFKEIDGNYANINIDILYLYSLTTSIPFYKNTYLQNIDKLDKTITDYNLLQHVFIYLNQKYIGNLNNIKLKKMILSLDILHGFEVNSIMPSNEIDIYTKYIAPDKCNEPNKQNDEYKVLTLDMDTYISNITIKHRKPIKTLRPPKTLRPIKTISKK